MIRVAIVGTNDPRNYSGGRYHALIMAYAVAAAGGECHVVTDHVPGFVADLEPLAPGRVEMHPTSDFASGLPEGPFDWVVIVPTGIFLPDFYESCLDFAARSGARAALLNFESVNWFNAVAPEPRDPRPWEAWRRCLVGGGLVLSSTRESDRHARAFYGAEAGAHLRFEVWSPPINTPAARQWDGLPKDGSLVAFVRPQDGHKGSSDLHALDPGLLRGRILRLVAGREIAPEFRAGVEARLAQAPGSSLEIVTRVSDAEKFRLVTAAQAVLFPSRFEGYGYPPVEAAYAGTETVCFDLPVLRETVGAVAHFAPAGDTAAFSRAVGRALAQGERRDALRAAVDRIADFDHAAGLLVDVLLRSADVVAPLSKRPFRVPLGPFARTPLRDMSRRDAAFIPAVPPTIRTAVVATSGDILVSGAFVVPARPDRILATVVGGPTLPATWSMRPGPENSSRIEVQVAAPEGIVGRRVSVVAFSGEEVVGDPFEFQVDRVETPAEALPVRFGISGDQPGEGRRRIRGWILACRPVTEIRLGDGSRWWAARVTEERADLLAKYPSYPRAPCQFVLDLPEAVELNPADVRLIALADGQAIDSLAGWPLAPISMFPDDLGLGSAGLSETASDFETLEILPLDDPAWANGIAQRLSSGRLGAVLVCHGPASDHLAPGAVLVAASGTARLVRSVDRATEGLVVGLDGPLNPFLDGFPKPLLLLRTLPNSEGTQPASFTLSDRTDERWWNGVWAVHDDQFRRCFFVGGEQARKLGIGPGARLRFAASGERMVLSTHPQGRDRRFELDGPIRPLGDGPPHTVQVLRRAVEDGADRAIRILPGDGPRGAGANPNNLPDARPGTRVRLAADAVIARGMPLQFPDGSIVRVVAAKPISGALEVVLDAPIALEMGGAPGAAQPLDEAEVVGRPRRPWLFSDAGYKVNDPLHVQLAAQARHDGRVVLSPLGAIEPGRPRVLFLTPVPPSPANQGNRVVTRNAIQHLLDIGFDVDVVLQGWIDPNEGPGAFGGRVRILALNFPDWFDCDVVRQRRAVAEAAAALRAQPLDRETADRLARESALYHPYFVVRDEVVEAARTLATTHRYAAIVVNYTHMLRVTHELSRYIALPPICVLTHDALSRLPTQFQGQALDTLYRACRPDVEQAALDAVPAVVAAISGSEAAYFRSLGVRNPVVLTEIDAFEEAAPFRVPEDGPGAPVLIFHGSANPMNLAGLDWFVDACWSAILQAEPEARLVVCGRIGEKWTATLPGIEIVGEIGRADMFVRCRAATIAINPCVAGTGLKIKTVEAACLGLPSVCLPLAVEGLEDVAHRFAIVAETGADFAQACITLLRDRPRWSALRAGGIAVAAARFSKQAVYAALDDAMGWTEGVAARRAMRVDAAPARGLLDGPEPTLARAATPLRQEGGPADLLARGLALCRAGQLSAGRPLIEQAVAASPGDPRLSALAGRLALDAQDYWFAAYHGAVVIGQRPLEAEGYWLVGIGLHGIGQIAAAVECFVQGLLAAPAHRNLAASLDRALTDLGRTEEAERWRSRTLGRAHEPDSGDAKVVRQRPSALLTEV